MRGKFSAVIAALALCLLAWDARAESSLPQYDKLFKSAQTVGVLGKAMAGDSTNFYSGNTTFSNTDLSVPGNHALPVAVGRSYTVESEHMVAYASGGTTGPSPKLHAFGDWELDIPYMSGTFSQQFGWQLNSPTPLNRCSVVGQLTPEGAPNNGKPKRQGFRASYLPIWFGNTLHVNGENQSLLVASAPNADRPTTGGPFHWTTNQNWWVSCLPNIANGDGEGFLVIGPDGTKYWFNWMSRRNSNITSNSSMVGPPYWDFTSYSQDVFMLPTRVEDRFGNWVTYHYSNHAFARLETINSSDGRQVALVYNVQGYVESVSDGTRSVQYVYNGSSLAEVRNPDGSSWQYGFASLSQLSTDSNDSNECDTSMGTPYSDCIGHPEIQEEATGYVVHPSGARVDFKFKTHFQWLGEQTGPTYYWAYPLGLVEKTITGPGLMPQKWYYEFAPSAAQARAQCQAGACPTRVWTDEISPEYRITRRMFGVRNNDDQGLLLQELHGILPTSSTLVQPSTQPIRHSRRGSDIDIVDDTSAVELTGTTTTITGPPVFEEEVDYFYRVGSLLGLHPLKDDSFVNNPQLFWTERRTPVSKRVTHLQDAVFTYQANTWDSLDRATSVSRFSSITPTLIKNETTQYRDDTARWIMGQVERGTTNGIETARTEFDSNSLPWKTYSFGKLQQTLGYTLTVGSQAGTLHTVTDGRNLTTTLSQWHRGIPQLIQHPDTTTQSAVVNNIGSVMSVTDENGYTTDYDYDLLGRLASIAYPTGDSPAWNATTIVFAKSTDPAYGLPAGHWRQTTSTGQARSILYFDALWRPVVKETYDLDNRAATLSQVVTRYDSEGQATFASYPQRNQTAAVVATWANPSVTPNALGVWTDYDALNRNVRTQANSEQGGLLTTTTEYLENFKTRVTNPRNVQTFTSYRVFDRPSFDAPDSIIHAIGAAEAAYTEIYRDIFGKPLQLRRRNADASVDVSRYYVYDGNQQLCKSIEPESGTSVTTYDAAGNVDWTASGQAGLNATNCLDLSSVASTNRVTRTYDARNRIASLQFPDGNGNQYWSYYLDGLPLEVTTENIPAIGASAVATSNYYSYNKRRLLISEVLSQRGWYNFPLGYGYDANGSLASQTYPSNFVVTYQPNALGQPTQVIGTAGGVGTPLATGATYYPNGALQGFTYGNGIVHAMQQNDRQLPASVTSGVVTNFSYAYDANSNLSQITDLAAGQNGRQTRAMTYDALDRLQTADSPMFGGAMAYGYDALDNLRSVSAPDRNLRYCYNTAQQLTFVRSNSTGCSDGAAQTTLGYDVQGNVANKNQVGYRFDVGNRLREASGTGIDEQYQYDAYGRRVLADRTVGAAATLGVIYSQYASNGQLMYQENARSAVNQRIDQVYLGGSLIAQREVPMWGGTATFKYQHTDALGSPVAVTNSAGGLLERMEYEPFGKGISGGPNVGAPKDGAGYTGHVLDVATGMNYMQQRYYDPGIGRFLSVDPVTANSGTGANFNRYWYANNNPYRFTDPDGRLARGTGFTDKEWKKFDRAQQRSATNLEKAAARITNALATGKGLKSATKSFEKNFGKGSGTAENMTKVASDMSGMAGALRNTGAGAIPANGMTTTQIDAAYGGNNVGTLAAVPTSGPTQVIVNTTHSDFGSGSKLSWAAGHETAHGVLGYKDSLFNGEKGYKFGSPEQIDSFKNFPSPLTNPDHLMDHAQ